MTSTITIAGNLTKDPELRYTPTGQATARLAVAVNRRWYNRQINQWQETTTYHDVVAWGTLAENAGQSLRRGDRVLIEGRLDQHSWENGNGDKRTKMEITANDIAASLRWSNIDITKTNHTAAQTVTTNNGDATAGDQAL